MINHNGIYSPKYNENASTPYMGDAVSPEEAKKAISFEQAMALFDELADSKDIAFNHVDRVGHKDGCCARAHIMCRVIEEKGLVPKKAWAFTGRSNVVLNVKMPDADDTVTWGQHVAVALPVRLPDGTVKNLVIDPSLFDGPVPLQEWGKIMHAEPKNVQIAKFGIPPKGYNGDYDSDKPEKEDPDSLAKRTMIKHLKLQSSAQRIVFPTAARQLFNRIKNISAPRPQGRTWVSAALEQAQPTMANVQTAFNI